MPRRIDRDEPLSLGDALGDVVRALRPPSAAGTTSAAALGGVFGRWTEAVGEGIARHVQPLKLDGTHLVVEVDDPAWATQLTFVEATLRERLRDVANVVVDTFEVRVRRPGRSTGARPERGPDRGAERGARGGSSTTRRTR